MRVFFLGPDGEEIGNARPGNVGCGGFGGVEWSAAVDGVHTVEVRAGDSIGEKTGSFEAVLAILKQETYEYDGNGVAVIEGEIDIARDVDDYEVDLQAGQSVSIAITEMGAGCDRGQWDLRVEFLDPSGAEIEDGWPGNEGCKAFGGLSWTARETGTHTVRVTSGDEFDLATGIYEGVIGLLQKEVKGTIDRDTPLEVAGEITVPFDYHDYLIELDQGEAVGVWTRSMGPEDCSRGQWDIRIWFLDPEGEELGDAWPGNNGCGGDGGIDWAAEESGTHVLRIGSGGGSVGDPIGVYDGRIAVLRQEVKPKLDAGAGVQLSDTIDLPLDVHYYPIDLAAGQAVSIDVTSMGDDGCSRAQWDMRIALLDADRNELQDGWPGNSSCRVFGGSDWAVDEGGEYLLAIFGGDSLPVPNGSYEVTVGVVSAR